MKKRDQWQVEGDKILRLGAQLVYLVTRHSPSVTSTL
jgi:hypothetical protein